MGILSYRQLINKPPKNAGFVADTSFIARTISNKDAAGKEAIKLKETLIENGSVLYYNVNIRHELYHLVRFMLIEHRFASDPNSLDPKLLKLWEYTDQQDCSPTKRLKTLVESGYVDLFQQVFGKKGEKLESECTRILSGFKYLTKEDFTAPVEWKNMSPLMAMYGLDSCDAMIVNLAVSHKNFRGIISADYDYLHCSEALDIVVPSARNLPATRPCFKE